MGRLQTARLENFIRRWGSIKGPGSVLSETLGDVFPVLDLENLTAENMAVAGWSLWSGSTNVTGGVAQFGAASVINPVGSGAIVVVDALTTHSGTLQAYLMGISNLTLLTSVINTINRDTRINAIFQGNATLGASTNAAGAVGDAAFRCRANIDRVMLIPHGLAVLGPGRQFQVTSQAANTATFYTFYGRVRLAEPSELSF